MTLDQLRIFVAVAEREHVTRAAEALGLTQSGVSAAILTLESRFAQPLFDRVGRGVVLTEAGRLLLVEAKAVLARVAAAEMAMMELEGLKRGMLRIHASQTIGSYWLPQRIIDFRKSYPDINVILSVGNTAFVVKAVVNGDADIGFIEGEVEDSKVEQDVVAFDRLILTVSRSHPWAKRKTVRPEDLLELDWVLREVGSGTRSVFESALKNFGLPLHKLKVALEMPSNEAVRTAVEAGLGATALSIHVVQNGIKAKVLAALPLELPERNFVVLRHRERRETKTLRAFLQVVKER